ncbi:MAG: chromosome segregation protein SMC [Opitutales bacterium]
MYLKEIVVNGFKSFADRTRIELRPGITAVVGPNGCGKSNIVDAIRWVLGEQSAKSLRAPAMQDVIFSGTDRRKALPQCEVELIFANCEKELGTEFAEVSVSRRLQREGTSDYFINGKPSRLKDIHRLFMDTGVGRMSYSFLVQGQIDQILSANPAERRYLFEEAAGITRYKTQRREALNKLAGVDANLARVTDVISEVGRQIAVLRRQAAKAMRYRRLRHRFTHLDLAWQARQFGERRTQVVDLEARASACRAEAEGVAESLRSREETLSGSRSRRSELSLAVEEDQQALFALRADRDAAEAQARTADLRAEDLSKRLVDIRAEAAEAELQIAEFETRLRGRTDDRSSADGAFSATDAAYREKTAEVENAARMLVEDETRLRRLRQDVLVAEGEMTRARGDLTNLEVDLRGFQTRHQDLTDSVARAVAEQETLARRANECATVVTARHGELTSARNSEQEAVEKGRALLAEFRALQQAISEQDRVVAKLSAQLGLLEQMQARMEGFSEAAKAVLKGEFADTVAAGKASALAELVTVSDSASATALEALLGAASEAVALDSAEILPDLVARIGERDLGRAVFQVEAPPSGRPAQQVPSWLRPAASAVKPKSPSHARLVANLFDGCHLCPSLGEFVRWWRANPSFDFFLVATPDGDLVDRRGLVFAGRPRKAAGSGAGVFSRESEIRSSRASLESENDRLTALNEKALGLQRDIDAADAEAAARREAVDRASQELSVAQADERSARGTLSAVDERIAREQRQLAEIDASKSEALARRDRAQAVLTTKDADLGRLRQETVQAEGSLETRRQEVESRRNALGDVRLSRAEQLQRLETVGKELAELESRRAEAAARSAARRNEAAQNDRLIGELRGESAAARERSERLRVEAEAAAAELAERRNELARLDAELETEDRVLAVDRDRLRDAESRLKSLEVSLAEQGSQCGFIAEKVRTEHQLEVADVDWRLQLWLADGEPEGLSALEDLDETEDGEAAAPTPRTPVRRPDPSAEDLAAMESADWPPLVREIADLRDRISGMGSVNLVAVEEYSSLRERHGFLTAQSDDLWKSKEELTKAIEELNQTSLQLFTETFDQVRKNFKFTFERLFVGGTADLEMVQSEDPLESGIDIIARPPGTKLRTITLLSGGQRAMTAVALLFAIYMVKPSPLCVLDELDAPLDDTNVGRFTDIVREFTKFSQFLVITHNKRTVSAADAIFGATMQEKGVTRLFSMRFNREKDEAEPSSPGGGFTMAR